LALTDNLRIFISEIKTVMRYIVRAAKNGEIRNIYHTDDYSSAFEVEKTAKLLNYDDVWICDCLMETLVG